MAGDAGRSGAKEREDEREEDVVMGAGGDSVSEAE